MTRTALITGATAGIGNAFARQLARRGTHLVIVARDTARLERIAGDLSSTYVVDVEVLTADLSTTEGMNRVADRLSESGRPVDLLVNNAGASLAGWFGSTAVEDEDRQLDLLVRAPMHLMDAAIKSMSGRGRGGIINVASVAAFTPRGAYSAHKAWLVNISQWANWHYADVGITVQALCPGFTRTEFHQRMGAEINNVPRWMWLKADPLVKASLRDLERGKAVSVPSLRYKVLAFVARHAPAPVVAKIAQRGR
jgi:short-subunit dehydrogenase